MAITINQNYDLLYVQIAAQFALPDPRYPSDPMKFWTFYVGEQYKWRYKEATSTSTCTTCGGTNMLVYVLDAFAACPDTIWDGLAITVDAAKLFETNDIILPQQGRWTMAVETSGQQVDWQDPNDCNRSTIHILAQWNPKR